MSDDGDAGAGDVSLDDPSASLETDKPGYMRSTKATEIRVEDTKEHQVTTLMRWKLYRILEVGCPFTVVGPWWQEAPTLDANLLIT